MTRKERVRPACAARHAVEQANVRTLRRELGRAARVTPDPQEAARLAAGRTRLLIGFVPLNDRTPHYLCDLGLTPPGEEP
ncbi:hypothetical protein [Deinococcus sp. NW-56]|uniref:hypothetical protein n=1 Tax=Deinococcus sp. NW-56 TaxID=2080419 RepID=UPI000CF54E2A|nr:hypothetical protein [Deinococcus sp. NW-56]